MNDTSSQYNSAAKLCEEIFTKKMHDYGTAWRILRPSSLTDQIFIKANRIRSIQEKGSQKIGDDIMGEFIGIVNYAAMALVQIEKGSTADKKDINMEAGEALERYQHYVHTAKELMMDKNHDYGEAWRDMRISSLTDIILMKIFRLKQIEDNDGKVLISEGPEGSYNDIINYAMFALIKLMNNHEV